MESVSAHGGLVHVELTVKSVTSNGVTSLIRNSPNLILCHFSTEHIYSFQGVQLESQEFVAALIKNFFNRKLFSCGIFYLANRLDDGVAGYNTELYNDYYQTGWNSELLSLWGDCFDIRLML